MAKKMYLVFSDEREMPIRDMISMVEPHIVADYATQQDLDDALEMIRTENLYELSVKRGTKIAFTFEDCALDSYQVHYEQNGTLACYFYFRENAHGLAGDDEEEDEEE